MKSFEPAFYMVNVVPGRTLSNFGERIIPIYIFLAHTAN